MLFESHLKGKEKEIILNILSILALCYHFDEGALFIFTAFNVHYLAAASNIYNFKNLFIARDGMILSTMALFHLLQYTIWMNPGPDYRTFKEIELFSDDISVL